MRTFFTVLFVSLSLVSNLHSQTPFTTKGPPSVEYVNLKKFSGLWYEIARTPNKFEKDCVAATVEYKIIEDEQNKLDVYNRCFKHEIGGQLIIYSGTAKALENDNLAKLDKTYFWIFTKEYKIIYLEENYNTAIMSDDKMENLWIMHRKPFLKKEKLNYLVSFLNKYMNTDNLIYTPQDKKGRYK